MFRAEDLATFLPPYLSEDTSNSLIENLKQFPNNIDSRFYSSKFVEEDALLQGDGISEIKICEIKTEKFKEVPCLLISNTCDMDYRNKRQTPLNISYAPIQKLDAYKNLLIEKCGQKIAESVTESIKNQSNTSYFYLPKSSAHLDYEGFVHLDKINNINSDKEFYKSLCNLRLFSLSQYGFYLFLFKLSYHLTRMKEQIDRDK